MKKIKSLISLSTLLFLFSCTSNNNVITVVVNKNDNTTFVNKKVFLDGNQDKGLSSYITNKNHIITSRNDKIVEENHNDSVISCFKNGYSFDTTLKNNEVILPSYLLLMTNTNYKDNTNPKNYYYQNIKRGENGLKYIENDIFNEVFNRIYSEDLVYKFSIGSTKIDLNVVGVYFYEVDNTFFNKSLYNMPIQFSEYKIYPTTIVSSTMFTSVKELQNKLL